VRDRLEFPDGTVIEVVSSPADPGTGPLELEFLLPHRCAAPPPHVHPGGQTERFEVLEGEFELLEGHTWHRVAAGSSLEVPPGIRHTFRNRSGAPVRVRNVHDPAHSFEAYIRGLHAIVREAGGMGPRVAIPFAGLWRRHSDTIRPSDGAVKLAVALLGRFAR